MLHERELLLNQEDIVPSIYMSKVDYSEYIHREDGDYM